MKSTTIKIRVETLNKLREVRKAGEESFDATIRRFLQLPLARAEQKGPKPKPMSWKIQPCETCHGEMTLNKHGLATCTKCNTTTQALGVYSKPKAQKLIKEYFNNVDRSKQPTITTQDVSKNTGIDHTQVEQILDEMSR